MKKILVLGSPKEILRLLRKNGWHVTVVDVKENLFNLRKKHHFDEHIDAHPGSFSPKKLSNLNFSQVIAPTEVSIDSWNKVAKHLQLSAPNEKALQSVRNKFFLKRLLRKYGYHVTLFKRVNLKKVRFTEILKEIGKPFILKPVNSMGSHAVCLIKNKNDYEKYVRQHQNYFRSFLSEKYIDAAEYCTDVFIKNGRLISAYHSEYLFFNKYMRLQANPSAILARGNIFNSSLPDSLRDSNTTLFFTNLCRDLGFTFGSFHIEWFFEKNKIYIGEVAYRLPGGNLPGMCKKLFNISYQELYLYSHDLIKNTTHQNNFAKEEKSIGNLFVYCTSDEDKQIFDFLKKQDGNVTKLDMRGNSIYRKPRYEFISNFQDRNKIKDQMNKIETMLFVNVKK